MVTKKPEPSTEVARTDVVDAAAGIVPRQGDIISQFMQDDQMVENEGAEATYKTIIMEILSSETVDDVLTIAEAESLKNAVGQRIRVFGFNFNESEYENGSPLYASIRAMYLDTQERVILNTGWQGAMAQLIRIHQLDGYPFDCVPTTPRRPNKFGSYPIRLQKVEDNRGESDSSSVR